VKRKPRPKREASVNALFDAASPAPAAVPVAVATILPPRIGLFRDAFSDDRGRLDAGEMMVPLAVIGILAISAYAVVVNGQDFNAQDVGVGCAALVTALLASRWGNAKMQTAIPPPSTVTTTSSTQVSTP
jgi:hypothetical protein